MKHLPEKTIAAIVSVLLVGLPFYLFVLPHIVKGGA